MSVSVAATMEEEATRSPSSTADDASRHATCQQTNKVQGRRSYPRFGKGNTSFHPPANGTIGIEGTGSPTLARRSRTSAFRSEK